MSTNPLDNYRNLVRKVDQLCARIEGEFSEHLACRAGCSGCCRHLALFPVEAHALAEALRELPADAAENLRARARAASPDGPCPLLDNERCLLYEARPIICRTHGLPIVAGDGDAKKIDFCPLNFQGIKALPGYAVINLETLNTTLAAINSIFTGELSVDNCASARRITIGEAILRDSPRKHPA